MTKQITRQQLSAALVERHGQERQQHLYTASVGIAGLGGLGSNIAVQLTRLGIGHLTLADCDRVEISNLNRQSYRLCDLFLISPLSDGIFFPESPAILSVFSICIRTNMQPMPNCSWF